MITQKTYSPSQLRAAFILWESDVRANRGAFSNEQQCREQPIELAAAEFIETLTGYAEKAIALGVYGATQ